MAESAVSFVLTDLSQLLNDKIVLIEDVKVEIQLLKETFLYLAYILKHLEENQCHRYGIQNWEADVVRGAHDAQDLVDTLVLRRDSIFNKVPKTMNPINIIFYEELKRVFLNSRDEKMKIQMLQHKMDKILVSHKEYGLQDHNEIRNHYSAMHHQHPPLRERLPRASREDVVGFQKQMQTLVDRLVNDDPRLLSTISITGMGGVGKTTLAQCIYSNADVKDRFKVRGWVSISQRFTPKGILLELLTELRFNSKHEKANLQRLQVPQLKTMLYEHLKKSRYLVILDDIWNIQAWDFIIGILPDIKKNRSRLVLTTRNNQVALHAGGYTHSMSCNIEPANSWILFRKKTFEVHEEDPELEDIGEQINAKCEGLPLLIVSVGSFLSRKTRTREWHRVLNSMTPLGPRGQIDHVLDNLALSYRDLTLQVKFCFLYLGFFPRDHDIPTRKLFHIWIAGGLISEDQATNRIIQSMEGKAESYLQELIDKNLVQAKKVGVDGKVKTCRVHPSVHEYCVLKGKEEIYLEVISTSLNDHPSINTRHKVIQSSMDRQTPAPKLRSLLFFLPQGTTSTTSGNNPHLNFKQFKLLRVLDLEGLVIGNHLILKTIGELKNLRYLNLRNTRGISHLHKSMSQLGRLLILDLKGSEIVGGLGVLKKMTSLRHLCFDKVINRSDSEHLQLETLTQLQSVGWVTQQDLLANDMNKLTLLRKLKLKLSSSTDNLQIVWCKIASLEQLECLHLLGGTSGNVDILENNMLRLANIKQLALRSVKVSQELMSIVAQLPHLTLLRLKECLVGQRLIIDVNGFSNLKYLELRTLENLEDLSMENGNRMCKLVRLKIFQCDHLTTLPDNIDDLLVG